MVESGTNVSFEASNSIVFGPNFQTQNTGTFTAQVIPCSANKTGNPTINNQNYQRKDLRKSLDSDFIRCFPNPSNGTVNVAVFADIESELFVFNSLGVELSNQRITPHRTYTFAFDQPGIYIFRFRYGEQEIFKKVVVQ